MGRRSIESDVLEFCGWKFLVELVKKSPSDRHRAVCSALFITGCRVSELSMLRKSNVVTDYLDRNLLLFINVPVEKCKGRRRTRTFPVRADEPLVPVFLDWVRRVDGRALFPWNRVTLYNIVRSAGKSVNSKIPFSMIHSSQLYPHWFRAQRAKQLRLEYDFSDENLRDWFGWTYTDSGNRMPAVYGGYGWMTLAKKMGIDVQSIFGVGGRQFVRTQAPYNRVGS